LQLLIATTVFCFAENNWEGPISDFIHNSDNLSPDEYWNNIRLDAILGKHSPKWQANTYVILDYLFKVIIDSSHSYRTHTYSIAGINDDELYAAVLNALLQLNLFAYGSSLEFRTEYQSWLKYSDSLKISDGYSDLTIDAASAIYQPINECRFETMSPKIDISDEYIPSYVNTVDGDLSDGDWSTSSVEEVIPPDISNIYTYTSASGNLTYISITDLPNTIAITAKTQGSDGNLISVKLLNPPALVIQSILAKLNGLSSIVGDAAKLAVIQTVLEEITTVENTLYGFNSLPIIQTVLNELSAIITELTSLNPLSTITSVINALGFIENQLGGIAGLAIVSVFENSIEVAPMPGALCSHITSALNTYAGSLITAVQSTANNTTVKPNPLSDIVSSVTLTGGSKTVNEEIVTQREHRYGYIPEADEILF
jgi:hypothetical protein